MHLSFFTIFGPFIQDMVIMLFSAGDLPLIVFSLFHYLMLKVFLVQLERLLKIKIRVGTGAVGTMSQV